MPNSWRLSMQTAVACLAATLATAGLARADDPITPLHKKYLEANRTHQYKQAEALPKVLNGLGIAILSTSKGVMTNLKAKELGIGGEVLCHIW